MRKFLHPLAQTPAQLLETFRAIQIGYKLKRTLRYSTVRDFSAHSESVAEHVWALHYLAHYFLPLEDPRRLLDARRIDSMCDFHDIGEIKYGDKPYHIKTAADEEREHAAALEIFAALPEPLASAAHAAWAEYEARETPEAKFVYALDKVEPLFELMDPVNEQSMQRLGYTYAQHTDKKLRATEGFPVMRRFVEVVSADMLARDIFRKE